MAMRKWKDVEIQNNIKRLKLGSQIRRISGEGGSFMEMPLLPFKKTTPPFKTTPYKKESHKEDGSKVVHQGAHIEDLKVETSTPLDDLICEVVKPAPTPKPPFKIEEELEGNLTNPNLDLSLVSCEFNESCSSLASSTLVEKLNLPTKPTTTTTIKPTIKSVLTLSKTSKTVTLVGKAEREEVMKGGEDAYILVSKGGSWSKEIQEEIHSTKIRSTNKLHVQICEMMIEMNMESSNGTSSTPILFVAKGDGSWKTYASGQVLNHMTSKHKIQVLQVGNSLDELVEEQVFLNSKQDSNPNQIKVKESHDWGTIFEPKPNKRSAGLFGWSTIPEIKGEPLRWMAKSSTFPMVRISMVQGTFRVFMSEIQASSDRTPMPSKVHTLSCATLNLSAEGVEQRKFQEIFKPNYPHAKRKKPPWVVVNSLDLRPCYEGIDEEVSEDLRTSPFLEGEIDTKATSTDKQEMAAMGGPPTRLRSTLKTV